MNPPRDVTVTSWVDRHRIAIVGMVVYLLLASTLGLVLSSYNLWSSIP